MSDNSDTTTTDSAPAHDEGDIQANIMAQVAKARAAETASELGGAEGSDAVSADVEEANASAKEEKAPKVADDPKMAGKFAALARKSESVRKREDAINSTARDIAAREQRVAAHEQQLSQQSAAYRELAEAERDPRALLAYLVKRGVPLESVVSHSMAENDPALRAEQVAKKALSETELLRKENEQLRKAREDHESKQANAQAESQFLTMLADETKFEAANTAFSKGESLRVAYHLDKVARSRGIQWGLGELAQAVNEFAESGYELDNIGTVVQSERYKKVKARFSSSLGAAGSPAPTTAKKVSGQLAKPAKTLTNSDSGERAQEPGFEDLTPEERIRRIAARARQGSRATMA